MAPAERENEAFKAVRKDKAVESEKVGVSRSEKKDRHGLSEVKV